ncbi:MAG: hypothetical protein ACNI27_14890 [Desulfovibrio sp.]
MGNHDPAKIIKFLGTLDFLLKRVEKAYQGYSANGRSFLYATVLRDGNEDVRSLVLENAYLLPQQYQETVLLLLHHIDVWAALWDENKKIQQPELDSEFVFPNAVTFPREEVADLMKYYKKILNT